MAFTAAWSAAGYLLTYGEVRDGHALAAAGLSAFATFFLGLIVVQWLLDIMLADARRDLEHAKALNERLLTVFEHTGKA